MSDESKLSSYLFFVEIDGIETARFQKCEGLEAETESFEYEEGGGEVHHFQGRTRYPNLVLEKGINDNNELFNWFQSITKDEKVERKNGSIVLKNNDNEELKRWNFFRALPCRWIGPKLDAKDRSSFAVERIEIAHEGIEVDNDSLSIQNNTPWFILDKICLKKQILSEQTKILLQLAQSKGIQKQAIIHGEPTMTKHLLIHVIIIMKNTVYQKVMTDMFPLKC